MKIERECCPSATGALAVTTGTPTTGFEYRAFQSGEIYVPATTGLSGLTWYVSHDGVTFYPAQDGAGTAVTSTVSTSAVAVPIPTTLQGAAFLALKSTGANVSVSYSIKS